MWIRLLSLILLFRRKYDSNIVFTCSSIYRLTRRGIKNARSCHRGRVVIILKGMRFRGYPRLSIIERIIIDQIGDSVVARFNGKRFALSDAS